MSLLIFFCLYLKYLYLKVILYYALYYIIPFLTNKNKSKIEYLIYNVILIN